jgi:hypothetical protein
MYPPSVKPCRPGKNARESGFGRAIPLNHVSLQADFRFMRYAYKQKLPPEIVLAR